VANWLAFTAVAGTLTALLLIFARRSQQVFDADGQHLQVPDRGDSHSDSEDSASEALGPAGVGSQHEVTVPSRREQPAPPDAADEPGEPAPADANAGEQPTGSPVAEGPGHQSAQQVDGDVLEESAPSADPPQHSGVELTPAVLLANVALTQGLVAVVVVAAGWYAAIPAGAFGVTAAPWNSGTPAVVVGVVFGLALWVGNELATTVADAAGAAYDESVRELLAPDSTEGWLVLFGAVLPVIAVAEELLFRAALIGVPAAGFDVSPWLLAVVASAAFALGHGAQGRVGIVVTGLLGLVLAAGYVLSGSLLLVVVAHYVVNATEFAVYEYAGREGLFDSVGATG
jgi:membrane protease YdiL (CAAX protease family)